MELKGKKIYFLGDSITEGVGASDTEHCYVSVFGKLSGAVVKNYGISATRIACQTENLTTKEPDLSFVNRADSMDSDADVVVVFGGTNDFLTQPTHHKLEAEVNRFRTRGCKARHI